MKLAIADPAAMESLGGGLARQCPMGTSLFLQGELGVGKTTLARGFLRALDYKDVVKSPTFTLVESYDLGGRRIYHFDLYRLTNPRALEESHDQHAVLGKLWPDGPGLLIYSGALSASLIFFLPDYSSPSGLHESSKERIFSPNFIIRKKKRFAFSFGSSYLLLFRLGESL